MIGVSKSNPARTGRLRPGLILVAALALAGCGSSERTLKLPAVKEAVQAAGLQNLRILTQEGGWQEISKQGLPLTSPTPADGPDYLQSLREPALLVIRFGKKANATRVVSRYKGERLAQPVGFARTCNVVVLNYAPGSASERSRARRVGNELRKRCT
jgi:hypothetical protein